MERLDLHTIDRAQLTARLSHARTFLEWYEAREGQVSSDLRQRWNEHMSTLAELERRARALQARKQ